MVTAERSAFGHVAKKMRPFGRNFHDREFENDYDVVRFDDFARRDL